MFEPSNKVGRNVLSFKQIATHKIESCEAFIIFIIINDHDISSPLVVASPILFPERLDIANIIVLLICSTECVLEVA